MRYCRELRVNQIFASRKFKSMVYTFTQTLEAPIFRLSGTNSKLKRLKYSKKITLIVRVPNIHYLFFIFQGSYICKLSAINIIHSNFEKLFYLDSIFLFSNIESLGAGVKKNIFNWPVKTDWGKILRRNVTTDRQQTTDRPQTNNRKRIN